MPLAPFQAHFFGRSGADWCACSGAHCSPPLTASGGACPTPPRPSSSLPVCPPRSWYSWFEVRQGPATGSLCLGSSRGSFKVTTLHGKQLGLQWCVIDHRRVSRPPTAACDLGCMSVCLHQGQALRAGTRQPSTSCLAQQGAPPGRRHRHFPGLPLGGGVDCRHPPPHTPLRPGGGLWGSAGMLCVPSSCACCAASLGVEVWL